MISYYKNNIYRKDAPDASLTLQDVGRMILNDPTLKTATEYARRYYQEGNERAYKRIKLRLPYVLFGGEFECRKTSALIRPSGLMCLDIDHQHNLDALRRRLPSDQYLNPQLIFTSPSGDGLKVVIPNPKPDEDYRHTYKEVEAYFFRKYGRKIDKTSDIARACFLSHDQNVWMPEPIGYIEGLQMGSDGLIRDREGRALAQAQDDARLSQKTRDLLRLCDKNPAILHLIEKMELQLN